MKEGDSENTGREGDAAPPETGEAPRFEADIRADWLVEAIDSITDSFVVYDRQWRFKYVNRKAESIMGHPREELLGRSVWEVFEVAVGSLYDRELHRALEEQVPVSFVEY